MYQEILINAGEAKVIVEPSDDDRTKLVCVEPERRPYEYFIQHNRLTVQSSQTKWYHSLKVGIDRSRISLCVPKSTFEKLSVKTNVGNIRISSILCSGAMDIQTGTGNIILENVSCNCFESKGNTGCFTMNHCTAQEKIFIKRNTGKVALNDCSAQEIIVQTNTGNVTGKLPHNMVFAAHTNTGKVETPTIPVGEIVGGRCEIRTNTGNIQFV